MSGKEEVTCAVVLWRGPGEGLRDLLGELAPWYGGPAESDAPEETPEDAAGVEAGDEEEEAVDEAEAAEDAEDAEDAGEDGDEDADDEEDEADDEEDEGLEDGEEDEEAGEEAAVVGGRGKLVTSKEMASWLEQRDAGVTVKDIAEAAGRPYQTVYHALRAHDRKEGA